MSLLTSGAIKVESFKNEQFISIADKDFTKALQLGLKQAEDKINEYCTEN